MVRNKAVDIALGVQADGTKDILASEVGLLAGWQRELLVERCPGLCLCPERLLDRPSDLVRLHSAAHHFGGG